MNFDNLKTWDQCDNPEHKRLAYFVSSKKKFPHCDRGNKWIIEHCHKRLSYPLQNSYNEDELKHLKFDEGAAMWPVRPDPVSGKYVKADFCSSDGGEGKVELVVDDDYIYEYLIGFEKFENSKILVVGGGPSTNDIDWSVNEYDYIFSCNHCYLSDKLKNKKVDLYFLGNEVDIKSKEFKSYFSKYSDTYIGCEDISDPLKIAYLHATYPSREFCCSSRWQAKFTGVGAKLILFALSLEPKELHYIGLDGIVKDFSFHKKMPHSFESKKLFRKNKTQTYQEVLDQYIMFDKYINHSYPNVNIHNLGKKSKYNCLHNL